MTFEEWWEQQVTSKKVGIDKDGWYTLLGDDPIYKDIARLAWLECLKNINNICTNEMSRILKKNKV